MERFIISFFILMMGLSSLQAQDLVSGKATLNKVKNGVYYIKVDNVSQKIDIRPGYDKHVRGTLSVLFKDCEALRQTVFDITHLSQEKLVATVRKYNECDYTPFRPTAKEVERAANFKRDALRGFATLGVSINRVDFAGQNESENMAQGYLGAGIAASPGFLGKMQGNLYITLAIKAAFSGNMEFETFPFETNFKRNTYQSTLGMEFHFNKNGTFHPMVGVGVGLRQNHYSGKFDTYKVKGHSGSGFFEPQVGLLFPLDAKKSLGFILSYNPTTTDDLSFINDEEERVTFSIDTYYLNAGVYLYF